MNKIFYFNGKQAVLDILDYRIIKSKKLDHSLKELRKHYENSKIPVMPVTADLIMKKLKISEGKYLGEKLRMIEGEWVKNNFSMSTDQVDKIINS